MVRDIILKGNSSRMILRIALWHIRYLFSKKSAPLACGLYLTSKCNFRCDFCNIWKISPAFQISEEKAREVIQDLGKMKLVYLSFSGGEPLLVPYIFDLLLLAKKSGILYTHIVSNGYLMDKGKARSIADSHLSEISFSLDGDKEKHNSKRNMPQAFEKVISAIEDLKKYSPKTSIVINTIIDSSSPNDVLPIVKLAQSLKVKFKVQPLNSHPCFNDGNVLAKRKDLGRDEIKNNIDVLNIVSHSPALANSRPFLENYKLFLLYPKKAMFNKEKCVFGFHHMEIFKNMVFPCLEGMNWKSGFNLENESIKKIINSKEYTNKLLDLKDCKGCNNNYYVCYYEPRLNFPMWNLVKSRFAYFKIINHENK